MRTLSCPYAKCTKTYASEGSLNLHMKIKHNGGNKTDREKIAKSLVFAKANGIELSKDITIPVNLPPGLIEKAADQIGVELDKDCIMSLESEVIKTNEETRRQMKEQELREKKKIELAQSLLELKEVKSVNLKETTKPLLAERQKICTSND